MYALKSFVCIHTHILYTYVCVFIQIHILYAYIYTHKAKLWPCLALSLSLSFSDGLCFVFHRIDLSAHGFYKTPDIGYNFETQVMFLNIFVSMHIHVHIVFTGSAMYAHDFEIQASLAVHCVYLYIDIHI